MRGVPKPIAIGFRERNESRGMRDERRGMRDEG